MFLGNHRGLVRDQLHELHVAAREAVGGGHLEELGGPGVDVAMHGMTEAGDGPASALVPFDDSAREAAQVRLLVGPGEGFLKCPRRLLDGTAEAVP